MVKNRDLPVGACLPVGDLPEGVEDRGPELRPAVGKGEVELAPLAREVLVQLGRRLQEHVGLPVLHAGEVAVGEVDSHDVAVTVLGDVHCADQGDAREDARSRHGGSYGPRM